MWLDNSLKFGNHKLKVSFFTFDSIVITLYLNNIEVDKKSIIQNKIFDVRDDIKIFSYKNTPFSTLEKSRDCKFVTDFIHPSKKVINKTKDIINENLIEIVFIKDVGDKLEERLAKTIILKIENNKICDLDEKLK